MNNFINIGIRNVTKNVINSINKKHTQVIRKFTSERSESKRTFEELLTKRRSEAQRSIVVQVSSEKSFPELYNYCSNFGEVIGAHHYRIQHEDMHYILIEFENEQIAKEAIDSSCYNEDLSGVPVRSPFLWFKAGSKKLQKIAAAEAQLTNKSLASIDGNRGFDEKELTSLMQSAETMDDQINILYNSTRLNDLGIRLRFIAASQIEKSISGMFPQANAQPFGSSVNGFGKMGCDLDLILRFDVEGKRNANDSRLVFHTKENLTNGRSQTQRQMESIGDMMQLFLPGVCNVRRILQARVPIIKFHHEHLNLEVDLSMSNLTGLYMSELFYIYGQIDNRVRPLIFCIRKWAQSCGLTNPSPGRWITNFSLTCLVIFFLQQMKNPIIPALNTMTKSATVNDVRITEDGINCTFHRDHNTLPFKTTNNSTVSELLLQFFEFYSQFDFSQRAISLNEGRPVTKPDHSAMYIVNPLEQVLNVSKNISLEECERLRVEVRNAAWMIESEVDSNAILDEKEKSENPWGLLNLFRNTERAIIRPSFFFKPRMVDVSELFDNNVATSEANQNRPIEFKNQNVKAQVQSIRSQTRNNIKRMQAEAGGGVSSGNAKGRRR